MPHLIQRRNSPSLGLLGQRKPLGVVGGMGSLATAKFLEVLARKSRVETDQDHIPFICLSAPNIPDRSQAISIGSDAPLLQILERAYWLEKAGCGAIAIPCNTAHLWAKEIKQALSVQLIDMVEITRQAIRDSRGSEAHNFRSISLGTRASMQNGLYVTPNENALGEQFFRSLTKLEREAIKIIADVKSGNITDAQENFTRLVHAARSFAPDKIILACSELSAICGDLGDDSDIVDPINILADACIDWWIAGSHTFGEVGGLDTSAFFREL
ncbi:amino acid racemase [Mesorhizobium sp. M8A.F.Ca.ET.165.01.1.1]|uniref:aspartate/glutamate racemase family protein n=1 Tax=Mesorhizobium sp. M8A.F.Ca.ET.165.01.1.1 TaxID=2563960 RepID=UPI001093534C|nr:amino acid racemase [Mesorhizobium sp. M8A.F.Ca.ET.165.01.1.1]TGT35765.1 aspartate/glutamate racemase family protein [Mesorhizobium sp. M8A.F.Ca.ET.165.01.1.1]